MAISIYDQFIPVFSQMLSNLDKILTKAEAKKFYTKTEGFDSLYGSTKIVDEFNVANEVYGKAEDISSYIDGSFY